MKKVLLYSGGLDSWLIDKLWKPDVKLYVNVGGRYSETEIKRLPNDVKVINFPLGQFEQKESMHIPMRNLYFLMLASNYGDEIVLGATIGDRGARDKTPEFLSLAENFINYLNDSQSVAAEKKIKIEQKYANYSKGQLVKEYLENGGSIEKLHDESFSCFNPHENGDVCLSCKPCLRKFVACYNGGYNYSLEDKKTIYKYIKDKVLPNEVKGTYYKDREIEGEEMEKAINNLKSELE